MPSRLPESESTKRSALVVLDLDKVSPLRRKGSQYKLASANTERLLKLFRKLPDCEVVQTIEAPSPRHGLPPECFDSLFSGSTASTSHSLGECHRDIFIDRIAGSDWRKLKNILARLHVCHVVIVGLFTDENVFQLCRLLGRDGCDVAVVVDACVETRKVNTLLPAGCKTWDTATILKETKARSEAQKPVARMEKIPPSPRTTNVALIMGDMHQHKRHRQANLKAELQSAQHKAIALADALRSVQDCIVIFASVMSTKRRELPEDCLVSLLGPHHHIVDSAPPACCPTEFDAFVRCESMEEIFRSTKLLSLLDKRNVGLVILAGFVVDKDLVNAATERLLPSVTFALDACVTDGEFLTTSAARLMDTVAIIQEIAPIEDGYDDAQRSEWIPAQSTEQINRTLESRLVIRNSKSPKERKVSNGPSDLLGRAFISPKPKNFASKSPPTKTLNGLQGSPVSVFCHPGADLQETLNRKAAALQFPIVDEKASEIRGDMDDVDIRMNEWAVPRITLFPNSNAGVSTGTGGKSCKNGEFSGDKEINHSKSAMLPSEGAADCETEELDPFVQDSLWSGRTLSYSLAIFKLCCFAQGLCFINGALVSHEPNASCTAFRRASGIIETTILAAVQNEISTNHNWVLRLAHPSSVLSQNVANQALESRATSCGLLILLLSRLKLVSPKHAGPEY